MKKPAKKLKLIACLEHCTEQLAKWPGGGNPKAVLVDACMVEDALKHIKDLEAYIEQKLAAKRAKRKKGKRKYAEK